MILLNGLVDILHRDLIVGNAERLSEKIRADGKVIIVTGGNTGTGV